MPTEDTTTTTTEVPETTTTTAVPETTTTTAVPETTTTTLDLMAPAGVGIESLELLTTTTIGYQTSTWNNITFADILGTNLIFVFALLIPLILFFIIGRIKRYNRTRN